MGVGSRSATSESTSTRGRIGRPTERCSSRRRGKKRNAPARGQAGRGCIPGRVNIAERPRIVEEKSRPTGRPGLCSVRGQGCAWPSAARDLPEDCAEAEGHISLLPRRTVRRAGRSRRGQRLGSGPGDGCAAARGTKHTSIRVAQGLLWTAKYVDVDGSVGKLVPGMVDASIAEVDQAAAPAVGTALGSTAALRRWPVRARSRLGPGVRRCRKRPSCRRRRGRAGP